MRYATLIAIAVLAYAMQSVIHEVAGHSLVATTLGARVTSISSVNITSDETSVSVGVQRLVSAAGSVANVITALVALVILRRGPKSSNVRYFLWLFLSGSLLLATGYLGFSALVGSGDWANVISGLPHPIIWRAMLLAVSAALYWASLKISVRELVRLIGSRSSGAARHLVIPAYVAGGLLFCAAASFNPAGPRMLIWAAAASFGSMAGVVVALSWFSSTEKAVLPIDWSPFWVLSAVIVASLFVAVLGPGIIL